MGRKHNSQPELLALKAALMGKKVLSADTFVRPFPEIWEMKMGFDQEQILTEENLPSI